MQEWQKRGRQCMWSSQRQSMSAALLERTDIRKTAVAAMVKHSSVRKHTKGTRAEL